jgi:hypothetical protein
MRRLISILLLLVVFGAIAQAGDNSGTPTATTVSTNDHGDAVLKAMLAELKRSQEKLQLGQLQRPYYIDYQVTEIQDNIADATLGALRTDQVNSGRLVRVVVRIGDYKQDSYFGEGTGAVEVLPTDNDELALRRQLWLATDKAYKSALSGFTEKQAAWKPKPIWRISRRKSRRNQYTTWPSWMWTWTNGSRKCARPLTCSAAIPAWR